jgi:hypothetical protein
VSAALEKDLVSSDWVAFVTLALSGELPIAATDLVGSHGDSMS